MQPIPVSDAELAHIYAACRPLPPDKCSGFLTTLADELRGKLIGPGMMYRTIVAVLPKFFDPPDTSYDNDGFRGYGHLGTIRI
jgi:hypothetical protein